MNISKIKNLIPAPEDGEPGLSAASGLFIPAIIWVEADEDGWSVGNQSFNVTPSVVVDGVSSGFEDPLTIVSAPTSVTATYNSSLGIIVISVADDTDPADYEGEVKVRMEAIVDGEIYSVTKGIPVVANRQGAQGNGIVSITRSYAISNVGTVANDTTEPAHQGNWSAGSPAVTSTYPYLWVKEVTVYTDTTKNTTKYYCVGKKGDAGIDGAGSEWVFIRTKTEVAPEIWDSNDPGGEDSNGHSYEQDDYLPVVHVASGEVEPNEIANRGVGVFDDGDGEYGECTDNQKGVTATWPYEWIARRSNVLSGRSRSWESYETATAANNHKMSLHARYSKDGEDGVTYEIIPSVSSIRADENGNVLTGVITVAAYKTKSGSRTSCGLGMAVAVGLNGEEVDGYWVQYSINGGSWTNCSNISTGSGIYMVMAYGVPGSAVSTITSGIAFRLLYGTSSSYSVVHQTAPLQVVRNGQTGQRGKTGRYYYYDGYFDSTKEYTATDNQAPYVAFDWEDTVTVNGVSTQVTKTSYYMLVADTNKPDSTYIAPRTTAASGVWEMMETSFKFLITEAIFTAFAKLGSAIFSGDFILSQRGVLADFDGTTANSDRYELFDPEELDEDYAGDDQCCVNPLVGETSFTTKAFVDLIGGRPYTISALWESSDLSDSEATVQFILTSGSASTTPVDAKTTPGGTASSPVSIEVSAPSVFGKQRFVAPSDGRYYIRARVVDGESGEEISIEGLRIDRRRFIPQVFMDLKAGFAGLRELSGWTKVPAETLVWTLARTSFGDSSAPMVESVAVIPPDRTLTSTTNVWLESPAQHKGKTVEIFNRGRGIVDIYSIMPYGRSRAFKIDSTSGWGDTDHVQLTSPGTTGTDDERTATALAYARFWSDGEYWYLLEWRTKDGKSRGLYY